MEQYIRSILSHLCDKNLISAEECAAIMVDFISRNEVVENGKSSDLPYDGQSQEEVLYSIADEYTKKVL